MKLCGDCGGLQRAAALLRQEQCGAGEAIPRGRRRGLPAPRLRRQNRDGPDREGGVVRRGGRWWTPCEFGAVRRDDGGGWSAARDWIRSADPASLREGDSFHARHRKRGDLVLLVTYRRRNHRRLACWSLYLIYKASKARPLLSSWEVKQLVDSALGNDYDCDEMERMMLAASLCMRTSSDSRPETPLVNIHC